MVWLVTQSARLCRNAAVTLKTYACCHGLVGSDAATILKGARAAKVPSMRRKRSSAEQDGPVPFPQTARRRADNDHPKFLQPSFRSCLVTYALFTAIGGWAWYNRSTTDLVDLYVSFAWSLPTIVSAIGLFGGCSTARRMRVGQCTRPLSLSSVSSVVSDQIIVIIPTIGRPDSLHALKRVMDSVRQTLPPRFPNWRLDLVVEEACPTRKTIERMASIDTCVRIVTVPASFQTPNRTLFKARANHYAHLLRVAENEAREDVWVLHMDDDTGLGISTSTELAHFVEVQRAAGRRALHLCQGVLCYPRELARNRLLWLADSVRPGCDIGLFSATTGRGSPTAGLHGEMLLVRASVESAIGWDFGPRTLVEDAEFALHFSARFPGRAGWVPALSYGACPATASDFMNQRERWVWGLLELVARKNNPNSGSRIPLRARALMLHNTLIWACAPLCHPVTVLLVCWLLSDFQTAPVVPILIPLWSLNAAYCVWLYWEGLKLNVLASATPSRIWWEPICLILLLPLFSLWEVAGIAKGIKSFLLHRDAQFTVIRKPA